MIEFKFSCPNCSQNFKVDDSIAGKKIECPSCQAKIIAPEPPKVPDQVPVATLVAPPPPKPAAPPPASAKPSTPPAAPKKAPEPAPRPQIPILTAEIKQEIIAAVRTVLANKDRWMPRFNPEGIAMYSAIKEGDKFIAVPLDAPEATHFSLLGAVLREFNARNVMRTAAGRKRFLDTAIPEAMKLAIKQDTGKAPEDIAKTPLTHEQTLKVLDLLETKFLNEADYMAQVMEKVSRIGKTRVPDLANKIEGETIITNEEIATALINEIEELKSRIAVLEAKAGIESGKKEAPVAKPAPGS